MNLEKLGLETEKLSLDDKTDKIEKRKKGRRATDVEYVVKLPRSDDGGAGPGVTVEHSHVVVG